MSTVLQIEREEGLATLTLHRPDAMNALNLELRLALVRAFRELQAQGEVRVVIVTGAGRAFCAGMDLKELGQGVENVAEDTSASDLAQAMAAFEGPIIGAVNGHAITAGFELALACDLRIASTQAKFGDTHARVGILPGWGLSVRLPRLIGIDRAKELSLTGNFLGAEQAERWGLVNRVVEPEQLLPTCRALARDMLSCPPDMLRAYKNLIDEGYATPFGEALTHEARVAIESAKRMTAEEIAARREGVQRRGSEQQRS